MLNCTPPSNVASGSEVACAVEAPGFCQKAEMILPGASGPLATKLAPLVNVGGITEGPVTCPGVDVVPFKLPCTAVTVTVTCLAADAGYQEVSYIPLPALPNASGGSPDENVAITVAPVTKSLQSSRTWASMLCG